MTHPVVQDVRDMIPREPASDADLLRRLDGWLDVVLNRPHLLLYTPHRIEDYVVTLRAARDRIAQIADAGSVSP